MMRSKLLAANWKMNKVNSEALVYLEELKKLLDSKKTLLTDKKIEIVIAPPFTALSAVSAQIQNSIKLAAQNMHEAQNGAYTGEISAEMLKSVGCQYVILGHSERRTLFKETDESIHQKIVQALKNGLNVIFCIGEKLQERESGKTWDILKTQISKGLQDISKSDLSHVVIAYEPVWAIGTGKNATPAEVEEAHKFIRKTVWDLYDMDTASKTSIIYGGSVKPDNFKEISGQPNVDGALVGGASLDPKTFIEILNQMA